MSAIYKGWASVYEQFEGETSRATWRQGIVAELIDFRCDDHDILDLGAGTGIGRRALLDAFPRSRVTCLDQSAEMLEHGDVPVPSRVIGDMSRFCIGSERFDFVVAGFDALNYLNFDAMESCLASVVAALKPGGKFIFDYSSRRMLKYQWKDLHVTRERGDLKLTTAHRYDPLLDRTRVDLHLRKGEATLWQETHYHYCVEPYSIDELAQRAKMEVLHVRDIERKQFSPSSITHVYVLQRNEDSGATHAAR